MTLVYFIEDITESGGVERIVCQKASILSDEYGHDVSIVSAYKSKGDRKFPLSDKVRTYNLGLKRARHDASKISRTVDAAKIFFGSVLRLRKLLRTLNPDVVFYVWVLGAMVLPFAGGRAKRIFESHLSRKNTPYKLFLQLMEKKADIVVCLTTGDASEYRHCRKKMVISNFLYPYPDCPFPDYTSKKAIAVGRLMEVKGFDRLIRMWSRVIPSHQGWTLDIYGIGPLHDDLQKSIEKYGVCDSVFLRGRTENIYEEYCKHSMILSASHAEGHPMNLLEAQACGLPAVTFDFEYGATDIVKYGVTGIVVPQDDEEAYCKALIGIMESSELREMMGRRAATATEQYTKENIMPLWENVIRCC